MGGRKQPSPPPGEPGYDGPANNFKPTPPPAPPAKRYTEGPWHVESRGTGEYDVITEGNGRVAGYMRLADARLLVAAPHMRSVLDAVLHQLEHGEASDFIEDDIDQFSEGVTPSEPPSINGLMDSREADVRSGNITVTMAENAARRDLQWCRREIQAVLKTLS